GLLWRLASTLHSLRSHLGAGRWPHVDCRPDRFHRAAAQRRLLHVAVCVGPMDTAPVPLRPADVPWMEIHDSGRPRKPGGHRPGDRRPAILDRNQPVMTPQLALFYAFAALIVLCSIMVVASRNPVTSAVFLVLDLFLLAANYALMEAHFI